MSEIVLGVGTSHSPLLTIDASLWADRGKDDVGRRAIFLTDGRVVSYDQLAAEVCDRYAGEATEAHFVDQAASAQSILDHVASEIAAAEPDALIIIGDDQEELFDKSHMPAIAIYTGEKMLTYPKNALRTDLPEWNRQANIGYGMGTVNQYPSDARLATHLVEALIADGVDVSVASSVEDPNRAGFGHAYGFILERLCTDRKIPAVAVMLNTYYPPNVPTPGRCYDIGASIAKGIASDNAKKRIVVIASGGLTHFHTDEAFDRSVLMALRDHDEVRLRSLPVAALRSGSSEILNWVMAAGALKRLDIGFMEYIPVRRTPAGTGIGLGFAIWRQPYHKKAVGTQ